MLLIKILGICFIAAALTVLLKQYKSEYAFLCAAAAGVIIFTVVLSSISEGISELEGILKNAENAGVYFKIALKALGIAYLTAFCADMCRDFGQSALAAKTELAGKTAIFLLSLPLLNNLLEIALKVAGR